MKAMTNELAPPSRIDDGDWLVRLLSDIQREVALQPSPSAVERIRARLLSSIQTQEKAAA
jgi:hypothetical protein